MAAAQPPRGGRCCYPRQRLARPEGSVGQPDEQRPTRCLRRQPALHERVPGLVVRVEPERDRGGAQRLVPTQPLLPEPVQAVAQRGQQRQQQPSTEGGAGASTLRPGDLLVIGRAGGKQKEPHQQNG